MRTFSYSDAKSHKFWTIDVTGTDFAVTYGKIGTAGQTAAKSFATAEKCQAEADKLVREKTGKGYVETTPKASVSDDEAFTKTLVARPDDRAAWSAYADYLTEQGDPRGEFMAVQIALEDESLSKAERTALKKTEAKLLKAHERDWLGPLAAFTIDHVKNEKAYRDNGVTHTFRRGWVAELAIPQLGVNLARAMVKAPGLQFLQALLIDTEGSEYPAGSRVPDYADGTYEPGADIPEDADEQTVAYHVLSRFPHFASVRRFRLGGADSPKGDPFTDIDQCHTEGSFAYHFVKQMPDIEQIVLRARGVDTAKLFALPMPNLRHLAVDHITRYPLEKLAANKTVTKLTHLICYPHALEDGDSDDDDGDTGVKAYIRLKQLRAVCRAGWPLEFLRLRLTDFGDDGAKELVASTVLKNLKYLDLTGGCITDDGAEVLANCPDLKRLEVLNLDENAMSDAGAARIQAVAPKATVGAQHTSVPPFANTDDLQYLYMGDME